MGADTPEIERVLNDYLDVWNGDFSKVDVLADSISHYQPNAPEGGIHGREAVETHIRELHEAFPDQRHTIDDVVAADEIVMTEWTLTGTHEGTYLGVPPTERGMELKGMGKTRIVDGKVREDRLYYDRQEMFEQLGLTED